MEEILKNKLKEVLKELIEYLNGSNSETDKNFILGRLSVVEELIKEENGKQITFKHSSLFNGDMLC